MTTRAVFDRSFTVLASLPIVAQLLIAGVTSHPFDMTAWISHQTRLFGAGLNPFVDWKFSVPLMAILLLSFAPHALLSTLGIPGVLTSQFFIKLPFIACNALTAVALACLVRTLGGTAREQRTAALLWLWNPVPFFFTAVHGQFDSLSTLLITAAVALTIGRDRWLGPAALVFAAVAKLFAFATIPLFVIREWKQGRHFVSATRLGVVSCLALVAAFPTLFITPLRDSFLKGIGTSGVTVSSGSRWTVWVHPLLEGTWLQHRWVLCFIVVSAVIALSLMAGGRALDNNRRFCFAVSAQLSFLILLNPTSNPQFFLWVLPLYLALAAVGREIVTLATVVSSSVLLVVSVFFAESPSVWFHNSAPHLPFSSWLIDPSSFAPNTSLSNAASIVAIFLTMFLALRSAYRVGFPDPLWAAAQWKGSRFVLGGLGAGGVVVLSWLILAFQPPLLSAFASAPDYPPPLTDLNSLPAARVERAGDRFVVTFSERHQYLLAASPDRVRLRLTLMTAVAEPSPSSVVWTGGHWRLVAMRTMPSGVLRGDVEWPHSLRGRIFVQPTSDFPSSTLHVAATVDLEARPWWRMELLRLPVIVGASLVFLWLFISLILAAAWLTRFR